MSGCTKSDGDDMNGLDGEEMAHADFKKHKYEMTLPEFADQFVYEDGVYENAVEMLEICQENLKRTMDAYKYPSLTEGEKNQHH